MHYFDGGAYDYTNRGVPACTYCYAGIQPVLKLQLLLWWNIVGFKSLVGGNESTGGSIQKEWFGGDMNDNNKMLEDVYIVE